MATPGWAAIGDRLREARVVAGQTQQHLADRVGLDRTALVRAEAGERKLDALELVRIARVLGLPLTYFVEEPLVAAVSRRAALADEVSASERTEWLLDVDLAAHARDAAWLDGHGLFPQVTPVRFEATGVESARAAAQELRRRMGLSSERPIGAFAEACELFGCYILSVPREGGGASLDAGHYGLAVVAGRTDPGRRRATAAHELGHFVLGDAYSSHVGITERTDSETWIDAFASEFLLPREHVAAVIGGASQSEARTRLVELSGRFRVSWSLAVRTAVAVADLDQSALLARAPMAADFKIILGWEPRPDLTPGQTGPAWRRAAMDAFVRGLITVERARELLHDALTVDEIREAAERAAD